MSGTEQRPVCLFRCVGIAGFSIYCSNLHRGRLEQGDHVRIQACHGSRCFEVRKLFKQVKDIRPQTGLHYGKECCISDRSGSLSK